jgi:hypothetical protein
MLSQDVLILQVLLKQNFPEFTVHTKFHRIYCAYKISQNFLYAYKISQNLLYIQCIREPFNVHTLSTLKHLFHITLSAHVNVVKLVWGYKD